MPKTNTNTESMRQRQKQRGKTQKAERYYVFFSNGSHDDKDMNSDL